MTIPDPNRSELNQLWISYAGIPNTVIKGGRQHIEFDDQRFIGGVPWRQLENSFDAVMITNKSIPNLTINAGYLGNIQNVLSNNEYVDAPIFNFNYKLGDYGSLVGYGYLLDYIETENYWKSGQTFGIRLNGATPKFWDNYKLLYTLEWSNQQDYGHRTSYYDVDRLNFMGGFSAYFLTFQGAMEQLNGNANGGTARAFYTPMGANHLFQGWADIFAGKTPDSGIRDIFATVSAKFMEDSLTLSGIYHTYSDDTGQLNYGDEWNFLVVKKFGKHYSVLAKYAYYNAGSDAAYGNALSVDTQKIWVQGNINF